MAGGAALPQLGTPEGAQETATQGHRAGRLTGTGPGSAAQHGSSAPPGPHPLTTSKLLNLTHTTPSAGSRKRQAPRGSRRGSRSARPVGPARAVPRRSSPTSAAASGHLVSAEASVLGHAHPRRRGRGGP